MSLLTILDTGHSKTVGCIPERELLVEVPVAVAEEGVDVLAPLRLRPVIPGVFPLELHQRLPRPETAVFDR